MTNTNQMKIIRRLRAIEVLRSAWEDGQISWNDFMEARLPIVEDIDKLQEEA